MIKLILVSLIAVVVSAQVAFADDKMPVDGQIVNPVLKEKILFTESLAKFVSGIVVEQKPGVEDGVEINSAIMTVPRYYGYHSFLLVLDNFICHNTTLTKMRTWRMDNKDLYVIDLSGNDIKVRIIYNTLDSFLTLSLPVGY